MKNRGLLISLSIILGLVLVCAILPLGMFALLLAAGSGGGTGTMPERTWQEQIVSGTGPDRVLILEISGPIGLDAGGFGTTQLSTDELISQIEQATEDDTVQAVVLRVESPGGGVVASDRIHTKLQDLRDAGKHLVVSMGAVAASGGYYVSAPAERIYANADTFTGSLGVIISLLNYEETLETIGVEQLVFKSGEFKDIGSPARELTDEERQILQEIVDQAYDGFVDVIAEGRNMPPERVRELADGRIYTGQQALELDLIDELGHLDAALDGAKELAGLPADALVVRYNTTPSLYDLLVASAVQMQQPADPLGLEKLTEPPMIRLEYRMVP